MATKKKIPPKKPPKAAPKTSRPRGPRIDLAAAVKEVLAIQTYPSYTVDQVRTLLVVGRSRTYPRARLAAVFDQLVNDKHVKRSRNEVHSLSALGKRSVPPRPEAMRSAAAATAMADGRAAAAAPAGFDTEQEVFVVLCDPPRDPLSPAGVRTKVRDKFGLSETQLTQADVSLALNNLFLARMIELTPAGLFFRNCT